jgi:L-ribulose-5-phosphate 3-epimerase
MNLSNNIPNSTGSTSRRHFLKTALVASSATLALPKQSLISSEKKSHSWNIGTCDWTLKTPLTSDSFYLAQRCGIEGMQYSFSLKGDGLDLRFKENREAIKQTVKKTGVGITSLGMAILNKVPYALADESQQIVIDCIQTMATMKKEAKEMEDRNLAAQLSPDIALMGFFGKADLNGHPDRIKTVIEKFKKVAPLAEKHGVILGIESLLNEEDHRHIIDSVDSPAIKVYYDTANSNRMGYDIYAEIESLGTENICEIHCKEDNKLLGDGVIDFERVKSILQKIGYKDWLIIEGSKRKGMSIEDDYRLNSAFMQKMFKT